MVEFAIEGDVIIAGSRILVPVSLATILSGVIMTVQGTVTTSGGSSSSGTVVVATIQNAPLVTVQGTVSTAAGSVVYLGGGTVTHVGTLLNAPLVTVQGTVTSVGGGTVVVGTVLSPVPITGTLVASGTINADILGGTVVVGTVLGAPVVSGAQLYLQTDALSGVTVSTTGAATVLAGTLQDLVVDTVFGTVVAGSILAAVVGVEPQTGVRTSTVVAGDWFGGTVQTGQRMMAVGPLGAEVAVTWTLALGGTLGVGTILGVYITAEQSTTR